MMRLLCGLLLAGVGCVAPPFEEDHSRFLGYAPDGVSARRIQQRKALRAREEAAMIPWAARVRFPSRREWERISSRRADVLSGEEERP